ncbi:MAG: outer membrane beta-barrel protein [Gemmatimonadales bacterium]
MRLLRLVLLLACLPLCTLAGQQPEGRVGIGVGVNADNGSVGISGVTIRVPIRLGARWRLEPSARFGVLSTTTVTIQDSTRSGERSDQSAWALGVLLAYRMALDSTVSAYVGPRFELRRTSSTQEIPNSIPRQEFTLYFLDEQVAAVAGAEVALGRHFSLGGEVSLGYTFLGPAKVKPWPLPAGLLLVTHDRGHVISTSGAALVRWYFR